MFNRNAIRYWIGVDPGVNTGVSVWDKKERRLLSVDSMLILEAQKTVLRLWEAARLGNETIHLKIEDARLRTWFGKSGREVWQGAGSIKRDCQVWEEFLLDTGIPHTWIPPKLNRTKLDAPTFKAWTKWTGRTNEHGRDSAMLVFNS